MFIITWNFYFVNNGLKNENRQKRALSIYANSVIKPRKDAGNSKQTAPFQSTGTGRRPMRGFFVAVMHARIRATPMAFVVKK